MSPAVRGNVEIFPTKAELTAAAAERFIVAADAAIAATETFSVALSGGETPRALYAALASPEYASRVQWPRVHVFWGDERCVRPEDGESNYRMAREALLDRVPIRDANIHRIRGEDAPGDAAELYERDLRRAFETPTGPPRSEPGARFDLVLLGLGANGHTASLFPQLQAVREKTRWAMAENVDTLQMWRITLTPLIFNQASEILFIVSGREKAAILRRVLYGAREINELPAQAIAPVDGRLSWLVDAAAATELPSK
jgi:6-phosphogluconolactonase